MKKLLATFLAAMMATTLFASCSKPAASGSGEASYITLEESLASEEYAIGFRAEDVSLALEVQNILDQMKTDGKIGEIANVWFGKDLFINDRPFPRDPGDVKDTSLADLKSRGKLILGLDDSFPPMGFRDEDNKIVGFDIDLATEVCSRMGVELDVQPIDWDSKELELSTGKIDCIWNGMTVTEDRAANMFLAKPYLDNRQVVIVKGDSGIKTLADLEGKKIGLQKGSSAKEAYDKSTLVGKTEAVEYADNVSAFMDLQTGRVDAFLVDEVAGNYIVSHQGKV